ACLYAVAMALSSWLSVLLEQMVFSAGVVAFLQSNDGAAWALMTNSDINAKLEITIAAGLVLGWYCLILNCINIRSV
ncbi:hypothetical protein, partial [Dokdonella sp.]|uniref:hypothetical protein n=1 Tax=Dokdonella sp. TaxID=2291710 RepID=UPI003BB1551D